jgi:hypothetical protein
METPDKKELITEMVSLLKAYEEPYEEGAWEDFNQGAKSKKGTYLLWIGIAALFAVILSAMPFVFDTKIPNEPVIVKNKPQVETPVTPLDESVSMPLTKDVEPVKAYKADLSKQNKVIARNTIIGNKPMHAVVTPAVEKIVEPSSVFDVMETAPLVAQQPVVKPSEKRVTEPVRKKTFKEFLDQETKMANVKSSAKSSKWDFGIELLPTVLQSKVNLGAGITTAYKLSEKFSLNSGISYIALNAGQKVADPQPVSLMSSKKLVAIDANIKAIDIPISLTFNVNKQLYTSVGVSYFNVLSERRSNNYLTEMEVSRSSLNSATGQIESHQTQVSQQNTEVAEDVPLDGNSYLGFMNFSVGHKQKLSKDHQIIIEPFLKVPVGKLSTQDLKLSNGGVKLRFSF